MRCLQAAASREQDERHFAEQQALLQKQLADLKLRAAKFASESSETSESLRKKRLKLQQDVEVLHHASPCLSLWNVHNTRMLRYT